MQTELDRREFGEGLAAFAALLSVGAFDASRASAAPAKEPPPAHDMSKMPAHWVGKEKLAFLIYPAFTALDMVGPHYMLTQMMGSTTQVVAKTKDPVKSDTGLLFLPDADFKNAVKDVDVLCVPGGTSGTLDAMMDDETLAFVKDVGGRAKYVCSVCTGSLILGAAGLLNGYKATSHWLTKPLLPTFGAIPSPGRFVRDRNRITAEGVTAGLDFGLSLLAHIRDPQYAMAAQLLGQYAPEPPFDAGEPETAPKELLALFDGMFASFVSKARATSDAAYQKAKQL